MPIYKLSKSWSEVVNVCEVAFVIADSEDDANDFLAKTDEAVDAMRMWQSMVHDTSRDVCDSDNMEAFAESTTESKVINEGLQKKSLVNVSEMLKGDDE